MAGGNLGDLWFQLGVKDNTSKELQKIIDKLKTGDDAANALLRALQGFGTKKSGFKEQAEKAKEFADVLNEINRRISKLKKNDKSAEAKDLQLAVKNALSYLDMLQRINIERSKISELRSLNPNVDTSKLREAELMLENINNQLFRLQNKAQGGGGGGVDSAKVLQDYAKVLQMTFRDVKQITDQFKKENPLSAFSGGAAKVEADIARVTEKLARMRDLMAEGALKGYNTNMLGGSITELDKILARLQAASGNKSILTDAAQMKNLLSDVAVEMTKAAAATQAYGREKGKVIALEREHERAINKFNAIQTGENQKKKALADIEILLKNIDALSSRGIGLGQDVSKLESVRSEIERIKEDIRSISGKGLTGQEFKNALANLSEYKTRAHDIMKDQRDMNSAAIGQQNFRKQIESTIQNLNNQRAAFEKNSSVVAKFRSDIDALNKFNETVLYSKGLGGDKILSDKIASETKKLEEYKQTLEGLNKELEKNLAIQRETQSKLHSISPGVDGRNMNGKALTGPLLEEYNRLLSKLESGKGIIETYKNWSIDSQKDQISAQEAYVNRLKELQKEASRLDSVNPSNLKDKLIQKNKELLQSEKEYSKQLKDNAKQRQKEIDASLNRIQSLKYALQNLWGKRQEAKSLNIDTTKVDAKIQETIGKIRFLEENLTKLRGDKYAESLGKIGGIGSGREVRSISHLASEQAKVNREVQRGIELEQKRQQAIVDSGAKIQSQLVRGFEKANSHAGKLNSTVQDLKSLFLQGGLVFGAQQFAMSIITTGGEMEKQHIALQSILGDMQNANTMFNQIKELALNSPFTFSELNRDVKQLAAYGVEYDQLYDTTKRLADMSSGLGVSFDRIALAFGQVQARGWLDGKELRQIAYAGIPLLDKLSKFYSKQEGRNVSTSEIKTRISNREVSFDDVKSIFWQMTDAGGQFYNMQQVLSETLLGRYNKLKDAWEIMLADFADGKSVIGGTFKFILDQVTNLVQLMHTLSPVVIGAMSGFAMKRVGTLLAGSAASNFLTNKEKIAQDIKARALSGQQLSVVEQRILATKKQITKEDLQTLITAKAITKTELQRLYLSGKISKEMYKQAMAQAGMNTFWTNFANKGGVAISLLGKSLGSMVSSLWAMIGGLPGLILTAVTMGIGYAVSKYQELSRAIEQSQSELEDRLKQIRDFRMDNSNGMAKALADGDTKEIDNLIESYKEKLKELAPYNFNNLVMKADEKKSHEERLKYLDLELQKLQEAEKLAKSKLNVRSNYGDLKDAIDYANIFYDDKDKLTYKYISDGIDKNIARQKAFSVDKYAEFNANRIKERIQEIFGDISKDDTLRLAAEQAMSSVFSTLGIPEDRANEIRASVLQAFGIGNKDSWLQGEVRTKMQALIDETFPEIGAKIRASIPLTQAEQDKVKELMNDAKQGLVRQYPELEKTLQGMLANSNFQAVIKLVFATDDKFNNMTSELIGRIPDNLNGLATQDIAAKYRSFAKKWGKDDSWYGGRNAAKSDIDAAYNEYQSAVKSKSKDVNSKRDAWILVRDAAKALLYYDYTGEGKKSNKPGKKNKGGHQEDEQLKRLQERLSSLKSARQMYQKYKSLMSDEEAKKKTYNLFPEVTGLNLDDYQKAVHSLLEGFSINTTERKKFQTSIYREVAEWLFDEKAKKEYEKKAADFSESMNKLSERWDLFKSLLEKTGSKFFAESAWVDAFQMDDKVQSLMDEYYAHYHEVFNLQNSLGMTDGEAKAKLKLPNQYEEWKKITELLRGNYVKSLQDAADIIEKTEDYEDKILKIRERYNELISKTNDPGIKARYEIQRDKEIGQVKLDKFKNSSDYLNFYGAIVSLGMDKAQAIGARIRQNINEALQNGAIDAREYAKEIKQLDEQLSKLTSPKKTFLNGGLKGMAEQKISDASEQMTIAASKIAEGKKVRELGLKMGDENFIKRGDSMIASGKAMMKAAEILFKDGTKAKESLDKFANVVSIIDQNVQGMSEAFNDIKETASLLGADTESDGWQDASAFFETFSGMSSSLSKVVTSAESGNVGGILAGVTGIFTSPIKAFAKAHDAKLDRQIKLAERQLNELKNLSSNISSAIEKTLGGIYSYERSSDTTKKLNDVKNDYKAWEAFSKTDTGKGFFGGKNLSHYSKETYDAVMKTESNPSAYADQLALLHAQEDELRKQRASEADKKKKDKDKIADYDQQIKEMELQIKTFAQDFLKDVYSIDMKSWASTLTDTIVSAWAKGEDAVDAYKKKVKEMVRDVVKNIVSQKIMEKALEKPLEWLTSVLDEKGQLDETDMITFAKKVNEIGDKVVPQIEGLFDAFKNEGMDFREDGSSSAKNSIKSITEETADLLCSYVNDIRLNVSVDRENIKLIADAVKSVPELNVIAESQLTAMNQLVTLAEYRNGRLDDMYNWMRSVTKETGAKSLRIK